MTLLDRTPNKAAALERRDCAAFSIVRLGAASVSRIVGRSDRFARQHCDGMATNLVGNCVRAGLLLCWSRRGADCFSGPMEM